MELQINKTSISIRSELDMRSSSINRCITYNYPFKDFNRIGRQSEDWLLQSFLPPLRISFDDKIKLLNVLYSCSNNFPVKTRIEI